MSKLGKNRRKTGRKRKTRLESKVVPRFGVLRLGVPRLGIPRPWVSRPWVPRPGVPRNLFLVLYLNFVVMILKHISKDFIFKTP